VAPASAAIGHPQTWGTWHACPHRTPPAADGLAQAGTLETRESGSGQGFAHCWPDASRKPNRFARPTPSLRPASYDALETPASCSSPTPGVARTCQPSPQCTDQTSVQPASDQRQQYEPCQCHELHAEDYSSGQPFGLVKPAMTGLAQREVVRRIHAVTSPVRVGLLSTIPIVVCPFLRTFSTMFTGVSRGSPSHLAHSILRTSVGHAIGPLRANRQVWADVAPHATTTIVSRAESSSSRTGGAVVDRARQFRRTTREGIAQPAPALIMAGAPSPGATASTASDDRALFRHRLQSPNQEQPSPWESSRGTPKRDEAPGPATRSPRRCRCSARR
jgi:hypothetical protein